MKKSTKGALAAGSAAALLLGGAGSLAYWTATSSVNGGAITSGTLSLSAGTCDSAWKYASGSDASNPVTLVVPGDQITKKCTYTIGASGDHLSATLSSPTTLTYQKAGNTGTTLNLTAAAAYDVNGTAITNGGTVTSANDGQTLTATFKVTFPYGNATTVNANDTQHLTATLDAMTVNLTQAQGTANPN